MLLAAEMKLFREEQVRVLLTRLRPQGNRAQHMHVLLAAEMEMYTRVRFPRTPPRTWPVNSSFESCLSAFTHS